MYLLIEYTCIYLIHMYLCVRATFGLCVFLSESLKPDCGD